MLFEYRVSFSFKDEKNWDRKNYINAYGINAGAGVRT